MASNATIKEGVKLTYDPNQDTDLVVYNKQTKERWIAASATTGAFIIIGALVGEPWLGAVAGGVGGSVAYTIWPYLNS